MAENCIFIPDELFEQFLKVTDNNRQLTKGLWGLASNPIVQKKLKLEKGFTANDFIDKIGENSELTEILDTKSLLNHINDIEDTGNTVFESMQDAIEKQNRLYEKYPYAIPLIREQGNGFVVHIENKSKENEREMVVQNQLHKLNGNLIDYIEKLGFSVKEVEGLGRPGLFSPMKARENADGLKEAIMISKGKSGQQSLPEEIAHLLVEGFQNNPFMQRLMNQIGDNTVQQILGDQYDAYYDEYDGDMTLLKKEAIGRLVAQNIVDRNGIGDDIRFVSDKLLDKMRNNLRKGSEGEIDQFLKQMQETVDYFVNDIFNEENIEMFDDQAVMNLQHSLSHIDSKISALKELVDKSYNIMAKRVKIKQLSDFEQKQSKFDVVEFKRMDAQFQKQQYTDSCVSFLDYVKNDCTQVLEQLKKLKEDYNNGYVHGMSQLKRMFKIINQANTIVQAYSRIIKDFSAIGQDNDIVNEIDEQFILDLQDTARDIGDSLNEIDKIQKDMNSNGMAMLYRKYWGGDKEIQVNGKKTILKLEDVLRENLGDMNMMSRFVNSLCDAQDPLLQMVDMLMKDALSKRDGHIFMLQQKLSNLMDDYVKETGSRDVKFLIEYDQNGKPTGMFKSDRDYARFHRDKNEYIQRLKDSGLKGPKLTVKIKQWELDRTELVNVAPKGHGKPRYERMPKLELYGIDKYSGMTSNAQRKLYDEIIEIKKELDILLPHSKVHLYRMPQKRVTPKDQMLQGRNIKGALKRIKEKFLKDVGNDVDYGDEEKIEQIDKNGKHVILDFAGKEVKKVPIFYTTWIDDKSQLDTNVIDTMLSYGAMALNYKEMSEVADFMEATNSLMQDRKIIQMRNGHRLKERFKPTFDVAVEGDYVIEGRDSESAKRLRDYIDANVYGARKNRNTIIIGGKEIEISKIGDAFKNYTSLVGLGYNIFSGTSNLTMGVAQTLFEAAGNSISGNGLFRLKDIGKANKMYFKEIGPVVMEQYNDKKSNKVSLLINKFDCMEEYYQQLNDTNYYGGIFKKIVGKHNPLILNSMGEHYLHTVSMLAALNNKKVRVAKRDSDGNIQTDEDGNVIYGELQSLYDAFEVKMNDMEGISDSDRFYTVDIPRDKKGNSLVVNEDGSQFTDEDMFNMKLRIQQVNHGMHGAFNETDRGEINKYVLGRMVLQFRQWMPSFYSKRFRKTRVNVLTGETEEGFYNTYYKFVVGGIMDLVKYKKSLGTRYKMLSNTQKANVWKGLIESSMAILLLVISKSRLGAPDKEDPAIVNLLKYNMYRLKMELVTASPISVGFLDNIWTLIKSPIPAMENIDRLINLLDVTAMNDTIKTGRYAGWNKYVRNLYYAVPYVKNVGKFIDMITRGDITMFNPYIKSK